MKKTISLLVLVAMLFPTIHAHAWTAEEYYSELSDFPKALQQEIGKHVESASGHRIENTTYVLGKPNADQWVILIYRRAPDSYVLDCISTAITYWHDGTPHIGSSGENALHLFFSGNEGSWNCNFGRQEDGRWLLAGIQGDDQVSYDSVNNMLICDVSRSGESGWLPGTLPEVELSRLDMSQVPWNFEEAIRVVDTTGYAVIGSNDDSGAVELRSAPSLEAESLGIYFDGAPVEVTEDLGEWQQVSIGGRLGYILRNNLVFGLDMLTVSTPYPQKVLKMNGSYSPVHLYDAPDNDAYIIETYNSAEYHPMINIIGVVSEDWYHVITSNYQAGYMQAEMFWDNGQDKAILPEIAEIHVHDTKYSMAELEALREYLIREYKNDLVCIYIDVIENKLVVGLLDVEDDIAERIRKSVPDSDMIIFREATPGVYASPKQKK